MTHATSNPSASCGATNPHGLLPSWADEWVLEPDACKIATVVIPDAVSLTKSELAAAVARAYGSLHDQLVGAGLPPVFPIRFWSFIPDIHSDMGDGLDRYMAFNSGRFAAYEKWFGSPDSFNQTLATGTAVGVEGSDLTISCLAASAPGSPVENPRQTPSYRYSRRFGPLPPCFARATLVTRIHAGQPVKHLLVGGTSSVRGEESMHADLELQTRETLDNLAALTAAAMNHASQDHAFLRHFHHLRVYHAPNQLARLRPLILRAFPQVIPEFFPAKICRRELMVEIEGVVKFSPDLFS